MVHTISYICFRIFIDSSLKYLIIMFTLIFLCLFLSFCLCVVGKGLIETPPSQFYTMANRKGEEEKKVL